MKVVLVSTILRGGPISHLLNVVRPIAERVEDVSVVCFNEDVADRFREQGVRAAAVPIVHKVDLRGCKRLVPHLRDADVVHTHDRRSGLLARVIGRFCGAAAVHTFHGFPEEIAAQVGRPSAPLPPGVSKARAAWLLHGYLGIETGLSRLGAVTTPSNAAARFLIDHGMPRARLHVVPSAIDVRRWEPGPTHDPFVVGVIANLEYWKGVDVLIDACSRVQTPIRLEVIGDGEMREDLERAAAAAGVGARFNGYVRQARERMRDIDLLALPSRAESFGIVALEAMADALPVVATDVGGVPEVVEDGVTGRLVEPEDALAMARAIEEVARYPEIRTSWGRAGAARAATLFAPPSVADKYVKVYETVHDGRSA